MRLLSMMTSSYPQGSKGTWKQRNGYGKCFSTRTSITPQKIILFVWCTFTLIVCQCQGFRFGTIVPSHTRRIVTYHKSISSTRNTRNQFHQQQKSIAPLLLAKSSSTRTTTTSDNDKNNNNSNDETSSLLTKEKLSSVWLFIGIPLLSLVLPLLLQFHWIGPLIVAKRMYIYTLAITVVVIGSLRSSNNDSPQLGTRLIDLTREIIPNSNNNNQDIFNSLSFNDNDDTDDDTDDKRFQEMTILNEVDDSTQAIILPLIVVSSLIASLFFILLQTTDFSSILMSTSSTSSSSSSMTAVVTFLSSVGGSIQSLVPLLVTASNALVITSFTRGELQRLVPSWTVTSTTIGAIIISLIAFIGPTSLVWPIQNVLCAILAIYVSRAIQIPRLLPIAIALSALVLYDVGSVGLQLIDLGSAVIAAQQGAGEAAMTSAAAAAASTATAGSASASSSVMGAVAIAKTQGGFWQPGLFQIRLRGGIVTDLLGLGDAVFPTLFSTFCLRFDHHHHHQTTTTKKKKMKMKMESDTNGLDNDNENNILLPKYFLTSIFGYIIGCGACELIPGIGNTGLPALLFLVPSMFTFVFGLAIINNNFEDLWLYDPSNTSSDGYEAKK